MASQQFEEVKYDISKTNQGGLAHRKREPKQVIQFINDENPQRCLVQLYKLCILHISNSSENRDRKCFLIYLLTVRFNTHTMMYIP